MYYVYLWGMAVAEQARTRYTFPFSEHGERPNASARTSHSRVVCDNKYLSCLRLYGKLKLNGSANRDCEPGPVYVNEINVLSRICITYSTQNSALIMHLIRITRKATYALDWWGFQCRFELLWKLDWQLDTHGRTSNFHLRASCIRGELFSYKNLCDKVMNDMSLFRLCQENIISCREPCSLGKHTVTINM